MCGRFVTASSPALLAERFSVAEVDASVEADEAAPDYNVSPRAKVMAVRERDGRRVLSRLRWGLVPSWAKDASIGDRMINARADKVATSGAYKRAFAKKRCLIPADGFYEWKKVPVPGATKPRKQPYFVHRRDGEPMAFAGLWEVWKLPDGADAALGGPDGWLRSCVIITTTANDALAPIHDRMPVVLPESAWAEWLDPDANDVDSVARLLVPAPADLFEIYEVSTQVNSARNNGPELAQPVEA